jgi:hypothetical protein
VKWITFAGREPRSYWVYRVARADFNIRAGQGRSGVIFRRRPCFFGKSGSAQARDPAGRPSDCGHFASPGTNLSDRDWTKGRNNPGACPGVRKLVAFGDDTFDELKRLGRDRMATIQELADEAFADVLKKHGIPIDLKDALHKSAALTTPTPEKPKPRAPRQSRTASPRKS